jgi:hypothetical protein
MEPTAPRARSLRNLTWVLTPSDSNAVSEVLPDQPSAQLDDRAYVAYLIRLKHLSQWVRVQNV